MIYSGIGSREIPPEFYNAIKRYAILLAQAGFTCRSGGADGSDTAFATGVYSVGKSKMKILKARHATPEMIEIASQYHPYWDSCNDYARKLHGRNVGIILGEDLQTHSDFVACYTEEGKVIGGTAMGISIAEAYDIPIYNLGAEGGIERFEDFLRTLGVLQ